MIEILKLAGLGVIFAWGLFVLGAMIHTMVTDFDNDMP